MSVEGIINVLKRRSPEYVSAEEIAKELGLSRAAVYIGLKRVQKREEIQIKIQYGTKRYQRKVTYYKLKEENRNI